MSTEAEASNKKKKKHLNCWLSQINNLKIRKHFHCPHYNNVVDTAKFPLNTMISNRTFMFYDNVMCENDFA